MARDRQQAFRRLAEKRVNKTIKDIRSIGKLADRSNYTYTEDQSEKIINVLDQALEEVKGQFERRGEPDFNFSLDK